MDTNYILNFFNSSFGTTMVVGLLVYVIKQAKPKVSAAWDEFTNYVETKASAGKYAEIYQVAENIWYQVEEDFRTNETIKTLFANKTLYFNQLLLSSFPGLTQDEIDQLRQAISGKSNAYKELVTPASEVVAPVEDTVTPSDESVTPVPADEDAVVTPVAPIEEVVIPSTDEQPAEEVVAPTEEVITPVEDNTATVDETVKVVNPVKEDVDANAKIALDKIKTILVESGINL